MHGGWLGVASLLRKSNFCKPKRAKNFRNVTPFFWCGLILQKKLYHNRHDVDRPSNNQLFRFRTLTSYCAMLCYAMLCYIYPYFKYRLCPRSYASKTLALRPFWQTYKQLCDNNLVSISYNLQFLMFFCFMICFVFER